ncbi:hypothetical protein LZ32DRAFT_19623 [Colletotrichum eremochloae]|nr:hypothetical protein LZ32DRAFT_19623 [Colletotrichum eremochloae]
MFLFDYLCSFGRFGEEAGESPFQESPVGHILKDLRRRQVGLNASSSVRPRRIGTPLSVCATNQGIAGQDKVAYVMIVLSPTTHYSVMGKYKRPPPPLPQKAYQENQTTHPRSPSHTHTHTHTHTYSFSHALSSPIVNDNERRRRSKRHKIKY